MFGPRRPRPRTSYPRRAARMQEFRGSQAPPDFCRKNNDGQDSSVNADFDEPPVEAFEQARMRSYVRCNNRLRRFLMASSPDSTVILSIARTPMGSMQGALAEASATDLGATAVKAAVERAGVSGEDIDRIYMGCVLPAGLGQAPARQAAIKAGLPKSVQATTVNKVCGSGMQTVIMGDEAIRTGNADVIIAGGMESMTNAPYLLKKY